MISIVKSFRTIPKSETIGGCKTSSKERCGSKNDSSEEGPGKNGCQGRKYRRIYEENGKIFKENGIISSQLRINY